MTEITPPILAEFTHSRKSLLAIVAGVASIAVLISMAPKASLHVQKTSPLFQKTILPMANDVHAIISASSGPYMDAATAASQGRTGGVYTDEALSNKSPVELGLPAFSGRAEWSKPSQVFGSVQKGAKQGNPLPTNEWFLNLLIGLDYRDQDEDDSNFVAMENRVYTIPYIIDTVGPIVGTRLHYPHTLCWGTGVQSSIVDKHGLTVGTLFNSENSNGFTRRYKVDEETLPNKLGVGLRWVSVLVDFANTCTLQNMIY